MNTTIAIWLLVSTAATNPPVLVYGPKFVNERDCQAARGQMVLISVGHMTHHCVKMEPGR